MANLNKLQRCYQCGALLQIEDKNKEGYINPEIIQQYPEGLLLCNHCYSTEKFANAPREAFFDSEYTKILEQIKKENALVVYVIDLFSFEGSFINKIIQLLKDVNVLVVANKRDLLPKEASDSELKEYVSHRLRLAHFNVVDVVITSTNNGGYNIDKMYESFKKYAVNKNIYVVGASVSGKSTLISELLKKYSNQSNKLIVTHTFEGTNLRGLMIPIIGNHYIYETPGTSIDNSLISKVERSVINSIMPKKEVAARKFVLGKDSMVVFGSICGIELLSNEKTVIQAYASDKVDVKLHKGNSYKFMQNLLKKKTIKPSSDNFNDLKDYDIYELDINEEGKRDLGVLGLGWINFEGKKQKFRIYIPKGVYVYTTRSKVKYVNK